MTNTNNLKTMSADQVREYIRKLERETNTTHKPNDDLEAMNFFEIEDYVADLERERGFAELARKNQTT